METNQSRTIDLDSCQIHYLERGASTGKTVIMLHGMKFNANTWYELGTMQKLANAGYHALALDMPGFGESPACKLDQDIVLMQFILANKLQHPILIGPSMGGRICLEFAINHPDLLGGLVAVGAVGVPENKNHLSKITVPTLIAWGSADQISSPLNADTLEKGIADSKKIIFADSPHPCYLDKPIEWHSGLIDFLQSRFPNAK